MEYQFTIRGDHKANYSAKDSPDGSFTRVAREIDLSNSNLFLDCSDRETKTSSQPLIPLAQEARAAFALLAQVKDPPPFVEALRRFGDSKLDSLLKEIAEPSGRPLIESAVLHQQGNKSRVERALILAIKTIDREMPQYFSSEKKLGTFDWLQSGAQAEKLNVSLAPEREFNQDTTINEQMLLLDPASRRIEFDARTKTAFVLTAGPISSADILDSLCNSGTLGRGALEANRAAALRCAAHPASEAGTMVLAIEDQIEKRLSDHPPSILYSVMSALFPMALVSVSLVPPLISHIVSNTIGIYDLATTAFLVVGSFASAKLMTLKFRLRKIAIEGRALTEAMVENFKESPPPGFARPLNTLAMATIDHTVSQSAGLALSTLGPKSLDHWLHDFPCITEPDKSLLPSKTVHFMGTKIALATTDSTSPIARIDLKEDFSGYELSRDKVFELGVLDSLHIYAIDRASETWNMLHAASLIREFAERNGLQSKEAPWPDIKSVLENSLTSHTDQSYTYPTVSKPFAEVTGFFKLDRRTWNLIARALASAVLLERTSETRRAQEIARGAFSKHFE